MRFCKWMIVGVFTAILVFIAGCEEEEKAVDVVEETGIVEEVQQADETVVDDYWLQPIESEICQTIGECRDLGDTYGSEHFTSFIPGIQNNTMWYLNTNTEADEYAFAKHDWEEEDLIIARYEIVEDEYVLTKGKEAHTLKGIADLVYALYDREKVDFQGVEFKDDLAPHIKRYGKLGMPSNWVEQWLQAYTVAILVHEYGHLLTINEAEFVFSETCTANQFHFKPLDECYNADSYMSLFYQDFLKGYDEKWLNFGHQTVEERTAFYEENKDFFVTTYATLNPFEDIAESFTHFMLTPYNDSPQTVPEEKINFFYQFPELIEYRAFVLKELKDRKDETMSFW